MFVSSRSLSDYLRFGRTQALTNDPGQMSPTLVPSSNARWQFTTVPACIANYECERPLDLPENDILILPSEKCSQSVKSGHRDIRSITCSSPLPVRLSCSDAINGVHFLSFLGSWLFQCMLQACCIACCHFTGCYNPHHRCVILSLYLRRHLILRHEFQALSIRCKRKIIYRQKKDLWIIVGSHLSVWLRSRRSYQFVREVIVWFCRRLPRRTGWAGRALCAFFGTIESEAVPSAPVSRKNLRRRVGGGMLSKACSFSQVSDHLVPGSMEVGEDSVFRYVAHVSEAELLAYPSPKFVHTSIPLNELFSFLPLSYMRKIAAIHGLPAGSQCSTSQLKMLVEGHSCIQCHNFFTVFSTELTPGTLNVRRVAKCRAKKEPQTLPAPQTPEFPPYPADSNLTHTILSNICSKMKPANLEEAGCAVCRELYPVGMLSRLKGIKNLLSIIEAPGVTRMERKSTACPVKEYPGPVLDHSCSQVCNGCRRDIRKGKVPRLALANNLWIGRVPEALKCLRYVEKVLVARVRHTCAYVKVASGMRKMKANVVAFESPTPKIYTVLPPPCDDMDEVLAILFTGPSKPTPEDFARTPFLVR